MLASRGSARLWASLGTWYASFSAGAPAQISSLVVVEHRNGALTGSTLSAIAAAARLGGPVSALVGGEGVGGVADSAARVEGVDKVLVADSPLLRHQQPEPYAELLASLAAAAAFTHVLAPGGTFGKNLLPRAAALAGAQPAADVVEIVDADTFVRPIYAGNALATVRFTAPGPRFLTARPTSFKPAAAARAGAPAAVEAAPAGALAAMAAAPAAAEWVAESGRDGGARPELGAAKVIIAGGRALKSKENFALLERLADLLGGAVAASRAAVDAGYVPNDLQVGQTGKVVAPELYVALGISGAIQHVAGIKDSKCIVAVNTDAEAPIFQLADYGLVQDLFTALPELEQEIAKLKKQG
ncbi:electron transfer flavo subunit beta [Raphidocelis subcapitata]|uniref:Electron transfer flavoprotein subunit alpha n=1 Tax=Raphidocelis subcapitata TaxID=307507 RepID=A0A2V0NWY8_9CHLO|nr:electron transfer flavo subunit beta [Raphidocelis subcapitata]|eukprot:GBF92141.1 electron transfer flavo subunit beta [Raphidocelis subcapitata]